MIRKKISRIRSTPKVYMSLEAFTGDITRQSYNAASGEYYPDRALTPLVLTPVVGYRNPDTGQSVANAATELTAGQWYRLDSKTTGGLTSANAIGNNMALPGGGGDRYLIDTTPGSATYGQMRVFENVSADNPVTYVYTATLAVGNGRRVSASFRCMTDNITVLPVMAFDNVASTVYNPWEDTRYFDIAPSVAGYAATFAWESQHDGKWGALGSTLLDWAVTRKGDGIRIDRTVMQDVLKLRCVATVTVGAAQVRVTEYVTHTRRLPKFWFDIARVGQLNASQTKISPYAAIKTNRGSVTSDAEVEVSWWGGAKATTQIGSGMNPSLAVSQLGAGLDLGLDVRDRGGWCALQDSDGAFLTDSDGALLIAR